MRKRLLSFQKKLKNLKIDAFLVSNFYNVFYLTGLKTLSPDERVSWLLVTKNKSYLFTDGRYYENVKAQMSNVKTITIKLISPEKSFISHLSEIIERENITSLGLEADDLRLFEYKKIKEKVNIKLISTEKIIIKMREIKDNQEIVNIKEACRIADKCLDEILKTIRAGQTEKEIAFKIERWIRERGFDLSFSPIVAADENSSLPHHQTSSSKIKKNSLILIDFGVKYKNYCSDITRIICLGRPSTKITTIYNKLFDVQQKTVEELKKNNNSPLIDQFCRHELQKKRLPDFPHSTGHGIGLEVHEYPKISQTSEDKIFKNQVFTIEPAYYKKGQFGIRIEDLILIKKDSIPQILTNFEKGKILQI